MSTGPRRAWIAAAAVTVAALAAAGLYLAWGIGSRPQFVEYPMPVPQDMPIAIAAGPDGTVWFSLDGADAVGRVRDGRLERLAKPGKTLEPLGLAVAPDGSAWYTDIAAHAVSRMTPSGEVTSFPLGTPIVRLGRLAVAPDGAAWFAEPISRSISRLKDGELTRHLFQSPLGGPYGVAAAADGTVWATLQAANQLLRIAPDGTISAFNVPRPGAVPTDIAVAPDGAVWFVEFRGNSIGRFKDGEFVSFTIAQENAGLTGIAVAEDGAVWFGMLRAGSLGRLRDERLETFELPRDGARPYSIAVDRAGNVWYADIRGYVGMLPARFADE
jgi:virginiamycin B lyase